MRLLVERVDLHLAPGPADRVADLAALHAVTGELLEQGDHALAMALARGQRPLVLHPLQQLPVAERQRLLGRRVADEPLELARVDPQVRVRAQPDTLSVDDDPVGELPAQRPQHAAQARPRALVEHVGPKP